MSNLFSWGFQWVFFMKPEKMMRSVYLIYVAFLEKHELHKDCDFWNGSCLFWSMATERTLETCFFKSYLDSQLLHLCTVSFLHEWWQYVHLVVILQKNCIHNYCTFGAFFLHEQRSGEGQRGMTRGQANFVTAGREGGVKKLGKSGNVLYGQPPQ